MPNEPNDALGNEDCVAICHNGPWNDWNFDLLYNVICERDFISIIDLFLFFNLKKYNLWLVMNKHACQSDRFFRSYFLLKIDTVKNQTNKPKSGICQMVFIVEVLI